MMPTENTSENLLPDVDIKSQDDLNEWRSRRPKKKTGYTHVTFVCCDCKTVQSLMLKSIKAYPIMCRSCNMSRRFDNPEYCAKIKHTLVERYGVENFAQSKEYREAFKRTCQQRYGVDHFGQTAEVKTKIRTTTLRHFDGIGFASKELRDKQRATMMHKYNAYHNMVSPELKQQFFDSLTAKYGGIGNAVPSIYQKQQSTMIDRYGDKSPVRIPEIAERYQKKYQYDNEWFDSLPEIQYYINLKESGEPFEYHPKIHYTYEYDHKKHYYYPDFKVGEEYIELKGPHFFGAKCSKDVDLSDTTVTMINPYNRKYDQLAQAKYECMKRNNIKIIIVDSIKDRGTFMEMHHIIEKSKRSRAKP